MNTNILPTTIPEYLEQLRAALRGADPAMVQDALYDAEEYLRSELAEQAGRSEAEVIASVAGSYGAPEEVAEIYRDTEVTVNRALRAPPAPKRKSPLGRFFGVIVDPRTYGALFYMLLSFATGTVYFTVVTTGLSLSIPLLILIIGVPLLVLFLGLIRVLSLVEGRIVEVLLGERMPRRPLYTQRDKGWVERIKEMFTDLRTWTAMLYFLLMMPLGIAYFTIVLVGLVVPLAFMAAPIAVWTGIADVQTDTNGWLLLGDAGNGITTNLQMWQLPVLLVTGFLLFFATLHLAKAIGKVHGLLAKHLLVRNPVL
ncbi:MAG TPA: sensor domain-containing protein [Pseudoxanthomonas sp.]|nr:sensor domain-containing protein [Pseudoxanthomonas sp.]